MPVTLNMYALPLQQQQPYALAPCRQPPGAVLSQSRTLTHPRIYMLLCAEKNRKVYAVRHHDGSLCTQKQPERKLGTYMYIPGKVSAGRGAPKMLGCPDCSRQYFPCNTLMQVVSEASTSKWYQELVWGYCNALCEPGVYTADQHCQAS